MMNMGGRRRGWVKRTGGDGGMDGVICIGRCMHGYLQGRREGETEERRGRESE